MPLPVNPQRGTDRWNAKLSEDDVRLIRDLVAEREALRAEVRKLTDAKIAEKFEVHPNTVRKLCQGGSWIHV
jgi:hypothetical protein